jgi:hypothetical protein
MTQAKRPEPKCAIMFSMAARSLGQAVMTLCSVAGMLIATGSPPFSSNCAHAPAICASVICA